HVGADLRVAALAGGERVHLRHVRALDLDGLALLVRNREAVTRDAADRTAELAGRRQDDHLVTARDEPLLADRSVGDGGRHRLLERSRGGRLDRLRTLELRLHGEGRAAHARDGADALHDLRVRVGRAGILDLLLQPFHVVARPALLDLVADP